MVLSVSDGETHGLVKTYFIHAHPDDQYHNYKQLDGLMTFRQNHGGRMDTIYYIDDTFILNDKSWDEELEELSFSESIKNRIKNSQSIDIIAILDSKNQSQLSSIS